MRLWVLWLAMVAIPAVAQEYQEYDEAAASETLAACLGAADEVHDCIGAVRAECRRRSPDEREFLELPCGEAEFGAWYELMQTEAEAAFRHIDAFEAKLLEGGTNPEYLLLSTYFLESQQGWEAYVSSHCAIGPLAAALQRKDGSESHSCETGKYADRIAELRHLVGDLN